jgi:hypothetical protein
VKPALTGVGGATWDAGSGTRGAWSGGGVTEGTDAWAAVPSCVNCYE